MTEEQKITAVESALDRHAELIAEARAAFRESTQRLWEEFCYGFGGGSGWIYQNSENFYDKLAAALGETQANEFFEQELTKYAAATRGADPEITYVFVYGTEEERRSFPMRDLQGRCNDADDAAIAEWVEDRKYQKNREAYAAKFYGVKS